MRMQPWYKCRSIQTRSCPCTSFSDVLLPLARKCTLSRKGISCLAGHAIFKVQGGLPYVVADRRAVASPHRPAGCGGLGPDGGGVEMCLNLRRISPARLDRLPAGPMKRSCYLEGQDSSDQLDFQTPPHGLVHAEINIPHLVKQAAGGQLGDITLIVPQDSGDSVRIALGGRLDGSIGQELIAGGAYCLWYSYPFSSMIFRSCSNVLVRRYCTVERLRPSRLAISTSVIPSR